MSSKDYGPTKSIYELLNDFASDLMMYHNIHLKEIIVDKQDYSKIILELSSKLRYMDDSNIPSGIIRLATSSGYVDVTSEALKAISEPIEEARKEVLKTIPRPIPVFRQIGPNDMPHDVSGFPPPQEVILPEVTINRESLETAAEIEKTIIENNIITEQNFLKLFDDIK